MCYSSYWSHCCCCSFHADNFNIDHNVLNRWALATVCVILAVVPCRVLLVFPGCYDGHVYTLCSQTGSVHWSYNTGFQVKCSPVVDHQSGYVYIGSHSQHFYCLNVNVSTQSVCVTKWIFMNIHNCTYNIKQHSELWKSTKKESHFFQWSLLPSSYLPLKVDTLLCQEVDSIDLFSSTTWFKCHLNPPLRKYTFLT